MHLIQVLQGTAPFAHALTIQSLAQNRHLSLIAITFASAYKDLKKFKYDFPDIALTATAMPDVDDIKLLRHPHLVIGLIRTRA